ncbi:tape measure protein [uncultured Hymenobacter sp.]|uniref:tape measure protein n=1 Tax=uncultured Hymenobacter sp. TaxID=170016 RepID=UPI0035CB5A4E
MSVGTVYTLDTSAAEAALDSLGAKEAAFNQAVRDHSDLQRRTMREAAQAAFAYQNALVKVQEEYRASKAIITELNRALVAQKDVTRDIAAEQKKATSAAEQKRLTTELQKSQAEERKLRGLIQESRIAVEQEADAVRKVTEARRQEVAQQRLSIAAQRDANAAAKQQTVRPAATSQLPTTEPTGGGFISGLLGKVGPLAAGLFSVDVLLDKVRDGLGKAAQATGIQATFNALTGSAQKGAQEVQYLTQQADALGLKLPPLAESYKGIFAAAKSANLSLADTRNIFEAVTTESTVLQLSNEKLEGALRAVQQMLSKGKVSAEELRGQLGEALPDATAIAARALGVNTQELDNMLRKGQIVSRDFLPKFAAEIKKTYGGALADASVQLPADLNRINSFFSTSAAKIAGTLAPVVKAFAELVAAPAKASEGIQEELTSLEESAQRIRETNVGSAQRIRLVRELQEQYPGYLGNLNAETVSNTELSRAIDKVSESLVNRLVVQQQDERIAAQAQKTAELKVIGIRKEAEARKALIEVQKQNEAARRRGATFEEQVFNQETKRFEAGQQRPVRDIRSELSGLPISTQIEQTLDLTNKGETGLVRTNSAYLRLVKTFQEYTFWQKQVSEQQQLGNDLDNEKRDILKSLGIATSTQVEATKKQADATQGFIDKLEAQKAALQKQKKELPGSFMDAGYRKSIDDFNTQIASIDTQLDALNNKRDKSTATRENKLKAALEAVLREQEIYRSLAEKATVSVADEARAASERQLEADLRELETAKQKLLAPELQAMKLGAKGPLADGKLEEAQLEQANIQEEAVYKAHYDRLVAIARQQEDFLLSVRKDSHQKQLDELDLRFDREREKYRKQPAELQALEEQYQRERRALLNKLANENLDKGESQAVTLVENAALDFQDPIKAERFKQQALLDVQIEFANKRLALAKAVNRVDGTSETRQAVTDLENLIGNLGNKLKGFTEGKPQFDIYKFILGDKGNTDENRAKVDEIAALAINTVNTILQAEQQAAQAKVEAKTREIDELERNLDRELQYNKAGSASNIANTRAEIAAAKAARREALEDQKKVAKQQQLIQDLTAASSIANAAANLILGWSTIPFVGQVLGAISVAAMIASFVATKAKTKQAASSGGEGFFKGGASEDQGYTGDGNPREESQKLGVKRYQYHKQEFIFDHETTKEYRYSLFEPLHKGRPDLVDWSSQQMQALLPDYSLPEQLRAEQKAVVEHRMLIQTQHQMEPLRAELRDVKTELVAIRKSVAETAAKHDAVPTQDGYMLIDQRTGSTNRMKLLD